MKKALKMIIKVFLGIIAVIVVLVIVLLIKNLIDSKKPAVKEGYYKDFQSEAELENYYSVPGSYEVAYWEEQTEDTAIKKYEVWYPAELTDGTDKYPVVVVVNASNTPASKYTAYLEKLASWGFIVVANEDGGAGSGESTSKTLDYIISAKDNCPVANHIDEENIGLVGASQGGAGAYGAATKYENSDKYKTLVTISAAYPLLSKNMGWEYDAAKLTIPTFMMAGMGSSDDSGKYGENEFAGVSPLFALIDNYNAITADVPKVRGRLIGVEHEQMLVESDPYVAAWFMYQLKNDEKAKTVFEGENAEIRNNVRWQDVEVKY